MNLQSHQLEELKEVLRGTKMELRSGLRRMKITEFQILHMDLEDIASDLNEDNFFACSSCSVWSDTSRGSSICETCEELEEIEDLDGPFK